MAYVNITIKVSSKPLRRSTGKYAASSWVQNVGLF
jgi:hypothetical protein